MTNTNEGIGKATGRAVIAQGVVGPRQILASWGTVALDLALDIRYEQPQQRYLLHGLSRDTKSEANAPGLTGEALRQIPVDSLVGTIIWSWVKDQPNPKGREPWGRTPPPDVVTERNVTDRLLLWVAHLWRVGHAVDGKGVRCVEQMLGVPRSRAARWVGFARERGFLDPAQRQD